MTESNWNLGRFVRVSPREDGTHTVSFVVPTQHRPSKWRSRITLPEYGAKGGSLRDPDFRRRVIADAARLNADLDRQRARENSYTRPVQKRLPELADLYYRSEKFASLSEAAQYRNRRDIGIILDWSDSRDHPPFDSIDEDEITAMLDGFHGTPFARLSLRNAWQVLCNCAQAARWRTDHPAKNLKWKAPRPAAAHVWTQQTVDRYADGAVALGQPGLAALIRVQFFVGQRTGDVRSAQHGVHYVDGRLALRQSKTNGLVGTALPRHLRDAIEQVRVPTSNHLFNDGKTGLPFATHAMLSRRFDQLRESILNHGEPRHVLRTLRHSAVCEMAKSRLSTSQIASRTGHDISRAGNIVQRYLLDLQGVADASAVQQHVAAGGSANDFLLTKERETKDWIGDTSKLPYFRSPSPRLPKKRGRPRRTPAPTPQWVDCDLSDDDCLEWVEEMGVVVTD